MEVNGVVPNPSALAHLLELDPLYAKESKSLTCDSCRAERVARIIFARVVEGLPRFIAGRHDADAAGKQRHSGASLGPGLYQCLVHTVRDPLFKPLCPLLVGTVVGAAITHAVV